MEWVEISGKTVEIAIQYGLAELGLTDRESADIEIISEGEKGFLGIGGKDALVRIKRRAVSKKRKRRKKGKGGGEKPTVGVGSSTDQPTRREGGRPVRGNSPRPQSSDRSRQPQRNRREERKESYVATQEQADVVKGFLEGLVDSFGLKGEVRVALEDDSIVAEVSGDQTEAMVGPRGSVIEAIHEISKTVVMRATDSGTRLRLDIAGHAERRRQALGIYANQLIDQVIREGGEVVLEPMSAADRKVIHDAAAEREGVRSYSEGESPRRYVVLAATGPIGGTEEE